MGTAPEVQDVVQWSFERNELITLHFSKVFEHICAEGVTDLSASALSQYAMKKQAFYWKALLRWIERRTESLKLSPVKFSLKIVLNDHSAWLRSVSQSTLTCSPVGSTLAQTFHSLTACTLLSMGVWICKTVQNQAVDTCMAFSVIFPIKPPAANTDFPLCVLGHTVPVKSCDWGVRQGRVQQLLWW